MIQRVFRRKRQQGQAAIMITLSFAAALGAVGLVVDVGWAHFRKLAAKTAAEAAASATAKAASSAIGYTCGLTVACVSATPCPASPIAPPSDFFQHGCLYAKQNGFVHSGKQRVEYASGITAPPVPGVEPAFWVSFTVSEELPQLFSAILGKFAGNVSARSTSAVFFDPSGACIYALEPHEPEGVLGVGSSLLNSGCGIYVNSDNSAALVVKGGGVMNASKVNLVGGFDTTGGGTINPIPVTGKPPVADPFGSVPQPTVPARCDSNGLNGAFSLTMPADGKYVVCGNIVLNGNGSQTFPPGMYIVKNGGIAWNNGTVRGNNVIFFLTGSGYTGVSIAGNMDIQLSAPMTGTYRGILFFQDRSLPTSAVVSNFLGGSTQVLNGSLYFSTTIINYTGGNATTTNYTGIVARKVAFKGTSYMTADTGGLYNGLGLPKLGMIE